VEARDAQHQEVPRILSNFPHIFYGADYNPEQWPEEVWEEDVRLMREAGVNLVSLGIFAWAKIEPRPGEYDFGWLDRVMDLLHAGNVMVNLATATASPPPWLTKLHPEILPVTRDGVTLWPGGRQNYCPSSAAYRERASDLVRRLASKYKDHPALAMWHVNNEYGNHVPECYCETSAAAFREWLQRRYGTLDALNTAWETAFWSQRYSEWDEINPPRTAPTFVNPTQQLDFKRFCSDELLGLFEMERAIVKEVTPDVPVNTNFMGSFKPGDPNQKGFFKAANYWKWARQQDFVSYNSYPDPADPKATKLAAMNYDLMRSLGNGRPWVLMEQVTSQVNWRPVNVLKRPGQMRLWSYQALARGADGVLFFQWRQSKAGAEKFHGALVPHVGTERSRVWREVTELGTEFGKLDAITGTRVPADVAILFSWENWWALEIGSKPSVKLQMIDQVRSYYEPLFERNIPVDFAAPDADLSGYKVVLVPNLYLVDDGVSQNLERFVADGGNLAMSFFSGIVDKRDHVYLGGYPAPFRSLMGIRMEEFAPYPSGRTNRIVTTDSQTYGCSLWSDVVDLEEADAVATFEEDFYAGRPAVTCHRFGRGASYYLGTRPDAVFMNVFLERICSEGGVNPPVEAPGGVEVVRRVGGERSFLFALNHNPRPIALDLGGQIRDLLTGDQHAGKVDVQTLGVAILEQEQ
jgi:beta-galactosidase